MFLWLKTALHIYFSFSDSWTTIPSRKKDCVHFFWKKIVIQKMEKFLGCYQLSNYFQYSQLIKIRYETWWLVVHRNTLCSICSKYKIFKLSINCFIISYKIKFRYRIIYFYIDYFWIAAITAFLWSAPFFNCWENPVLSVWQST